MSIAMLLEQGSTASSVSATLDMFRLAQRFDPQSDWRLELLSARGGTIQLVEGLTLQTRPLPKSIPDYKAVILPGFFADSLEQLVNQLETSWIANIAYLQRLPRDSLVAASCFGTFALAESKLLDGLSATTTWWLERDFRQRYPLVSLDADKALVDSGRVITAGAMTAHVDMTLHLLRRLGGAALARNVGGIMLIDGARSSQRPFAFVQRRYPEALIQRAVDWMISRLSESFSMEDLAEAMHVSYRTLNRRFVEATGMPPLAYHRILKVEHAKALLETTGKDFPAITQEVGYEDTSSFRRLFRRATGLTPAQYRKQFRAGLVAAQPAGRPIVPDVP
jgi:transcriptional regulator GlxA family with amidase domain